MPIFLTECYYVYCTTAWIITYNVWRISSYLLHWFEIKYNKWHVNFTTLNRTENILICTKYGFIKTTKKLSLSVSMSLNASLDIVFWLLYKSVREYTCNILGPVHFNLIEHVNISNIYLTPMFTHTQIFTQIFTWSTGWNLFSLFINQHIY